MSIYPTRRIPLVLLLLALLPLPTLSLAQTPPPDGPAYALSLDGDNDYAVIPDSPALRFGNQFTIEFWFKAASLAQGSNYLVARSSPNTAAQAAVVFGYSSNQVEFYALGYSGGSANNPGLGSALTLPDTNWHHIAYSYDGTIWSGYLDGVQVFSVNRVFSLSTAPNDWTIGVPFPGAGAEYIVAGAFDELRLWNVGRSAAQIRQAMNRPLWGNEAGLAAYLRFDEGSGFRALDATGNSAHSATLINGAGWTISAVSPFGLPPNGPGSALSFDGTDDHVTVPHSDALNTYPLTVSAWVKTSRRAALYDGIVSKYGPGSLNGYSLFLHNGRVRAWYFRDNLNYVWDGNNGIDGGDIADGDWHHVALVVDAAGGRILVDGTVQGSLAWTGSAGAPTSRIELQVGRYFTVNNAFLGQIDEVRVWNTAQSQAQIQETMGRQLWGNEAGLVACWQFDEGTGPNAFDVTGKVGNTARLVSGPAWVNSTVIPFAPTARLFFAGQDPDDPREVRLSGLFGAQDARATIWWEWGPSPDFANSSGPVDIGAGAESFEMDRVVPGLIPGVTYVARVRGTNIYGTSYSPTFSFVMGSHPTNVVLNLNDSGYGSLREVIRHLLPGDTVHFAPDMTGVITLTSGEIPIPRSMRIEGPGADRLAISGNGASRLFIIGGGIGMTSVAISGLTLSNGLASGIDGDATRQGGNAWGGAILNWAYLTVSDCVFSENSASAGRGGTGGGSGPGTDAGAGIGGAVANYGALTLINTHFSHNRAIGGIGGQGGAGNPDGNPDGGPGGNGGKAFGGAIYNNQGSLSATNCSFLDNFCIAGAGGRGGAGGGTGGLGGSGGRGGDVYGGAFWHHGNPFTLVNCTFGGAQAFAGNGGDAGTGQAGSFGAGAGGSARGGAIFDSNSGGTLIHCTIAFNSIRAGDSAAQNGAGSAAGGGISSFTGSLIALNTALAHNNNSGDLLAPPDLNGQVISLGHNFIGVSDGSFGWVSSDIVGTRAMPRNPMLPFDALVRTLRCIPPMRGSPLIDAGDDTVLGAPLYLATEQRGGPRRAFGHVDIGAVEVGSLLHITGIRPIAGAFDISFNTERGFPHRVESKDALGPGSWTPFGPIAVVGDGGVMTVRDTRPPSPTNRFYRAVLTP